MSANGAASTDAVWDRWLELAATADGIPWPDAPLDSAAVERIAQQALSVIRSDLAQAERLARYASRAARKTRIAHDLGLAARISGHVQLLKGRPKTAVRYYERSRAFHRELIAEQSATAIAMLQALAYIGQYERAFDVAGQALEHFQAVGDRLRAARVQANLANALHRLDRLDEAREQYAAALEQLQQIGTPEDVAIAMRNSAVCLMALGEWEQADLLYSRAREYFENAGQTLLVLEVDLNRAYLLGRVGKTRDALLAYRSVRRSLEQFDAISSFEIAHSLLDQADFMLDVGLWTDAENAALEAATMFDRMGLRFELGKARLFQAMARRKRGETTGLAEHLAEARQCLKAEPNPTWQALLALAQADAALLEGKLRLALRGLRQARDKLTPGNERRSWLDRAYLTALLDAGELKKAEPILQAWNDEGPWGWALRARWCRLSGQQRAAEERARAGLAAYDRNRAKHEVSVLRQAVRKSEAGVLSEALACISDLETRFEVLQRWKHQTLSERLQRPTAWTPARESSHPREAPPSDANAEHEFRAEQLESDWISETAALFRAEPHAADYWDVFEHQGEIRLMALRRGDLAEVSLGTSADWHRRVRSLKLHLSRGLRDPEDRQAQRVLDEIAAAWPVSLRPDPERPLVMSPVGPLRAIPWHAVWPELALSLVPSYGVFRAQLSGARPTAESALVIGAADDRAPRIELEAAEVAELLGVRPKTVHALEPEGPTARWIHLAAHGVFREDRPLLSRMLLGAEDRTALELSRLSLRAEGVSLSGCSTGLASVGDDADTQGFVEALLQAGARQVLAALWDIDDASAHLWMVEFYRQARPGTPWAETANWTRKALREQYPHPVFWAPFTVFGFLSNFDVSSKGATALS